MEEWPPLPVILISKSVSLAKITPCLEEISPNGAPGKLCIPNTSWAGKRSKSPSSIIAFAPSPCSSFGWKTKYTVPEKLLFCDKYFAAPNNMVVWPSCPHACMIPEFLDTCVWLLVSIIGSASISALSIIFLLLIPLLRTPTNPVFPTPACTSKSRVFNLSNIFLDVLTSLKPNSGYLCKSLLNTFSSLYKYWRSWIETGILSTNYHIIYSIWKWGYTLVTIVCNYETITDLNPKFWIQSYGSIYCQNHTRLNNCLITINNFWFF